MLPLRHGAIDHIYSHQGNANVVSRSNSHRGGCRVQISEAKEKGLLAS